MAPKHCAGCVPQGIVPARLASSESRRYRIMKPRSLSFPLAPLFTLFTLLSLLTACEVESAFARRAYLQMEIEPEHARVEIDERPSVSARLIREEPVELSVGKHTITIRA